MNKEIKKKANDFVKRNRLKSITFDSLSEAIKKQGYTLILFNRSLNNSDVETIINNLNLYEYILNSRGFTYTDGNYRLLFLNESLNDEEKVLVLAHEIGHIVFNHVKSKSVIGNDVTEEHKANEFAHYLLNPNLMFKTRTLISSHKKAFISISAAIVIIILCCLGIMTVKKEQSYYGNYYITTTGNKYHKKDCIFIKDKKNVTRLTKEEFDIGEYEPCGMCLPND